MLHTPSNRANPGSGEHITKIIRQHYKPQPAQPYSHELVQCRTDTTCQKSKPEDYWKENFRRRKRNLEMGFYSIPAEPYKPIGGDIILDPYELVLSALPGSNDRKYQPRVTRRGTIYEPDTSRLPSIADEKSGKGSSCESENAANNCSSAGFNDIKKILKESRERIVSVQAGMAYEDHIKAVENKCRAEEARKPVDTSSMVVHSISSLCLPVQIHSRPGSRLQRSRISSPNSGLASMRGTSTAENKLITICESMKSPSPILRRNGRPPSSILQSPTPSAKGGDKRLSLIQCSSGITSALMRKERQLREHLLFLKSVFSILTALHNMKLKDIRSKVPLSKDCVERLQKEGYCYKEEERSSRANYAAKFGKSGRLSSMDVDENQDVSTGGRMSVFGTVKRINTMDNISKNIFGRRRSRNATSTTADRPQVETWEDLLNTQAAEYKEDSNNFGFQVGLVTKFMRWYRRASIIPSHQSGIPSPGMDMPDMASEKQDKVERESSYMQAHLGSAAGHTERTRKLPIWQQVAQEKSTVFHNKKVTAPVPETVVLKFKRDLKKLKRSLQKENTAELEKLVRERVASFRLKYRALSQENCSVLLEEQLLRVQEVKENVNRSQLENFDVQPSKWYEELREKTLALVAAFDNPQIVETITKLQTHAHMDNKTVPLAKAKLCLLMMSLPAYDICQIYVQRALKFIFENILLGQEAQFDEWLNHRKIPYVVLDNDNQIQIK